MPVASFRCIADTFVREDRKTQNYGTAARLVVNNTVGTTERRSYLFFGFEVPRVPAKATIVSATLKVYLRGAWAGGPHTITAQALTQRWREGSVTWDRRKNTTATNEATAVVTGGADDDEVTFDVTAMMQAVADGQGWHGIQLTKDTSGQLDFHSSESGVPAVRPVLVVEWSQSPRQPVDLVPSGDQAVDVASPTLVWTFEDYSGDVTQAQSQVQVDEAGGDFSAPLYDSGQVANTLSEWDLSGLLSLTDATGYVWRVKVWDGAGLASEYSDPASFSRDGKGVLSLTAPGATVEETTPTLTWTLTGATQSAFEVTLLEERPSGGFQELFREDRQASTDLSYQLAAGYITDPSLSYKVVLRVWDDVDRATTPGDPPYHEDEQTFAFVRSATPTAPSSLTATADADGIAVVLDWSIAVAPEWFALRVGGKYVLDRIDPADVLVSGTDYRLTTFEYRPEVSETFEIEAVVDDAGVLKHSQGNPTDTLLLEPTAIWLVDAEDVEDRIEIRTTETPSVKLGDDLTVYNPVGRRDPVTVQSTVRGYEGGLRGTIHSRAMAELLEDMKGRVNRNEFRLILGSLNIGVLLGSVSVVPTAVRGIYACEVDFYQVSGFTFEVQT